MISKIWNLLIVLQLGLAMNGLAAPPAVVISQNTLWVQSGKELRQGCQVSRHIWGCTQFVEPLLAVTCTSQDGSWSMETAAHLKARMILTNPSLRVGNQNVVQHEATHLGDVGEGIQRFLLELEAKEFASFSSCDEASIKEKAEFTSHVTRLVRETNTKRH